MVRTGAYGQLSKNTKKNKIARLAWPLIAFACFMFFFAFQGNSLAEELVMVTQAAGVEGN